MFRRPHSLLTALATVTALIALMMASGPAARAGVVFGNLGSDGSGGLGTTSTTMENGSWVAQGFNTGSSSQLTVQSVTLGMFTTGTSSVTVSIFSGTSEPAGAALFTSAAVDVSSTAKYTFDFTEANLAPNTNYWVIPSAAQWIYNVGSPAAPTEQNASGYAYVDTLESTGVSPPSGPWTGEEVSGRYSVSIMAVPEPQTLALIGTGAAVVTGGVLRRRRKSG